MSRWIHGPLLQYSMNAIYRESSVAAIFERKRERVCEKEGFPHPRNAALLYNSQVKKKAPMQIPKTSCTHPLKSNLSFSALVTAANHPVTL